MKSFKKLLTKETSIPLQEWLTGFSLIYCVCVLLILAVCLYLLLLQTSSDVFREFNSLFLVRLLLRRLNCILNLFFPCDLSSWLTPPLRKEQASTPLLPSHLFAHFVFKRERVQVLLHLFFLYEMQFSFSFFPFEFKRNQQQHKKGKRSDQKED